MINNDNMDTINTQHEALTGLIPWYVKGKLNDAEKQAVALHLQSCAICRNEIAACQNLTQTMAQNAASWKPSAAHFAGILAEVDKLETPLINDKISASSLKSTGFFHAIKTVFSATPKPVRWTLALQTFAVATLVAILMLPRLLMIQPTEPYKTLSDVKAPVSSQGKLITLVFKDETTAKEINRILLQNHLLIRNGPSSLGAYVVEVPTAEFDQIKANLASNPLIRLALPVSQQNSQQRQP